MSTLDHKKCFATKHSSKYSADSIEKLAFHKQIKQLNQTKMLNHKELFEQQDKGDARSDELINEIEEQLHQRVPHIQISTLQWRII